MSNEPDPRDISWLLELDAFWESFRNRGDTRTTELHRALAAYLRQLPVKRGRGGVPLSMRQINYRRAIVRKARQLKDELVAKGVFPMDAEAEAAEFYADGSPWAAETIRRAMQNRTDNE